MRFVLIFALLFATSSCSSSYSVDDVSGVYLIKLRGGTDKIELENNGTYVHTFINTTKVSASQSGSWTLNYLDSGYNVVLNDFEPLLNENIDGVGIYLLPVRRRFGNIFLITNIDLDSGYHRISTH